MGIYQCGRVGISGLGSLVACLVGLISLTGCGGSHSTVADPLTHRLGVDRPDQRTAFWHELSARPIVCNDEAFHALLACFRQAGGIDSYARRVERLKELKWLDRSFDEPAEQAVNRGTLAVVLVKALDIRGGLTMWGTGVSPRYAVKSLEYRQILPPSSPNQSVSGSLFLSIFARVDDYRSTPADAFVIPAPEPAGVAALDSPSKPVEEVDPLVSACHPLLLQAEAPSPVIASVSSVMGEDAFVLQSAAGNWEPAVVGMGLVAGCQIRTGLQSTVLLVFNKTSQLMIGRASSKTLTSGPGVISVTGIGKSGASIPRGAPRMDTTLEGPRSVLAIRGTVVELVDEAGFDPAAISLTGRAIYINPDGRLVPFGEVGNGVARVRGNQTYAAKTAEGEASIPSTAIVAINDYNAQEAAIIRQRGGLIRGDVLVGNSFLPDAQLVKILPRGLNFVLQWDGGPSRQLNDLNLAVLGPNGDFVANPPFYISLNPDDPRSKQIRQTTYPEVARRNGQITAQISPDHVGPEGREVASFGKGYAEGLYKMVVFDLLDVPNPPTTVTRPVSFWVDVFKNGQKVQPTYKGTIGELQTVPLPQIAISRGIREIAGSASPATAPKLPLKDAPFAKAERAGSLKR